jgi:hypothetical protein
MANPPLKKIGQFRTAIISFRGNNDRILAASLIDQVHYRFIRYTGMQA